MSTVSPAASPTPSESTAPATPASVFGTAAEPIEVQATGMVLADDKGAVVMCPPFAVAGVGTTSTEIPTPECAQAIPMTGADLTLMASPQHNRTHRWGQAHIVADWNGTRLTVRSQRLPTDADQDLTSRTPDDVPCPAPAGGWKVGGVQEDPGVQQIQAAVGPAFGALAMGYPHGGPTNTDGTNPSYGLQNTEQVVVVGVASGELAQTTTAIRKVFKGNLCVVRSTTTAIEVDRQNQQLLLALRDQWSKFGVISVGGHQNPLGQATNQIEVVVETPELHRLTTGIQGPPIFIDAWIKPVR